MYKYRVESRSEYTEIFDNYVGDYITAKDENEAIEIYKECLMDMGCTRDEVSSMEFKVEEV